MQDARDHFIAIVGMSCRFAGSEDLKAYWLRILKGAPAITPYQDKSAERYLHEDADSFRRITTLNGGYLNDLWQVRGTSLNLPQSALAGTNPEFPLAVELALNALRDVGENAAALPRDRISAIIGYSPTITPSIVGWCQHAFVVDQTMEVIRRCFPHGSSSDFDALNKNFIASLPDYDSRNTINLFQHTIASAIADKCNICGSTFCVDRGEISSHVAIQAACDALILGRADLVLAGAIQGLVTPAALMPYSRLGVLSKNGSIHPFGKDANGSLPGEGGGFLALKRHSDALKAGDRIYAIIRACDIASDGNSMHIDGGLASAIKKTCSRLPTELDTFGLLEANGTGIPSFDKAEVKAVNAILGTPSQLPPESIALGSVKALIGHTAAASGIAGTIKAALSLYHRVIPPSQEAGKAADYLKLAETPFYLNPRPRPWIHNDAGPARRAGVSAIAFGRSSAHLLLEQSS